MKTVIIENIDGLEVVKGFDIALIDAVETQKIVREKIKTKDSFKKLKILGAKHMSLNKLESQDKSKVKALKEDIKKFNSIFKNDLVNIYNQNKVYFEPRNGEAVVSEAVYRSGVSALRESLKNKKALVHEEGVFSQIIDLRGKEYYVKENGSVLKREILKIGEDYPPEKIDEKTDVGMNEISGGDLKKSELSAALRYAAIMKSQLEIQGISSSESLLQSQSWYNDKVAEIDIKYS